MDTDTPQLTSDERLLAMMAHLLGIFTGFIGPLILWLLKREEGGFVEDQAKESLNFQIFVLIASFVSGVLVLLIIGAFMLMALGIYVLVICIIASIQSYGGEPYRYPLTLRLIS